MPDGPKSGLVLSDSITVGQLTFVLRIAVQILSYGGLAIIGTLVLANTPRLAPITTHDVISRNVGAATSLKSTAKWLFSRIRRNSADPYPPTNLFLALLLSITYAGFVALSDVGFLGFYSCDVPGKSHYDTPASANSTSAALSVLTSNLINGTDPNQIKAFRCDSYEVLDMGSNIILDHCTSWKNGTYGDASFFNGLNTTDTDVLMPRQLNFYNNSGSGKVYLNNYYNGLGTVLNPNRQIINGLAIDPHEQGLTAIIGVPTVQPDFAVTLDRAIGLEVDIGCMTTGIIAGHTIGATQSIGWNAFSTTGDWRRFAGPEYMRDILSKTVDDVRAAYRPSFDGWPTNSDGGIYNLNDTDIVLNRAANIQSWRIPTANFTVPDPGPPILGNCTQAMMQKLGIKDGKDAKPGDMCGLLGLGGQITDNGELAKGFTRMVCATAAQVNMVRATVGVSVSNDVSMSFTRRPSDLFNTRADLWDEGASPFNSSVTQFLTFEPYARYTLSDNPQGQTQHYIQHESLLLSESSQGVGSAGPAIAGLGHSMVNWPSGFSSDPEYAGLGLLPEGFNALNFTLGPNIVTNWIAQIGSSALVNSVGYNGWVSHDSSPILVESTGGHAGTCYTTPYAFGFLPLLAAAFVVILWALMMIVKRSYTGSDIVKNAYGGMATYTSTVCPGAPKDTLVVWEQGSEPRLQVVNKGMPVVGDGSVTALKYLKSGPTYPYA